MKSYLRYVPTESFGVIASSQCTDLLIDGTGKVAITPSLEDVCAFNLRQATNVCDQMLACIFHISVCPHPPSIIITIIIDHIIITIILSYLHTYTGSDNEASRPNFR